MSSSNPQGSQSNIISTITTLFGSGIDVSCNLLYKECVDKNNVDPVGCGGGGIISQRNFILAQNNFNLQRTINSTFRRDAFTQYNHNNKNYAGVRFNTQFPSYCDNCNKFSDISNANCITPNLENTFLNKKAYIFRNRLGNVISGPIINYNNTSEKSAILFGGNTGSGLTRNQQLSNMGKGRLPNGRPGLRFGVQSLQGISLKSNSNIYNENPNGLYGATIINQVNNISLIGNSRDIPVKIPICKK